MASTINHCPSRYGGDDNDDDDDNNNKVKTIESYFRLEADAIVTLEGYSNLYEIEASPTIDMWISGYKKTYHSHKIKVIKAVEFEQEKTAIPRSEKLDILLEAKTAEKIFIKEEMNLEIDMWLYAKNNSGAWCKMPAGSKSVNLYELIMKCYDEKETTLVINIDIPKADNYHKATLYLHMRQEKLTIENIKFVSVHDLDPRVAGRYGRVAIDEFLKTSRGPFANMNEVQLYARNDVVAGTHLSQWRTRHGDLPPEMYFIDKLWASEVITGKKYFKEENMIYIFKAMLSHVLYINSSYEESELIRISRIQFSRSTTRYSSNFTIVVCVLAELLSFYSNCCPYVGDFIHKSAYLGGGGGGWKKKVMIESFDDLFRRGSGDCEDLDWGISMMTTWLARLQLNEKDHGLLYYMKLTLELYVDLNILGNVSSAALSEESGEDESKWGAHMFGVMLPVREYYAMVDRGTPSKKLVARVRATIKLKQYALWTRDVPILILEGTGRMRPLLKPCLHYFPNDQTGEVQIRLDRIASLKKLRDNLTVFKKGIFSTYMEQSRIKEYNIDKELIGHGRHLWTFYKTLNQCYSPYLMKRGLLAGRGVFLDLQSSADDHQQQLMYSVSIEKFLYRNESVAIRLCNPTMPHRCWNQSMHLMHYHLSPVPLLKYHKTVNNIACYEEDLRKIVFSDDSAFRHRRRRRHHHHQNDNDSDSSRTNMSRVAYVHAFVRPQDLTSKVLDNFISELNKTYMKMNIIGVDYRLMNVSKKVGTICIRFKMLCE